jgi:glycosyltransferase involved in cell wall biosynthesis
MLFKFILKRVRILSLFFGSKKIMNVCILGHYPPHIGGVSSHTYLLSQELVKRGDNVIVLTYPHQNIHDYDEVHVETAPTINIKGLRGFFFFISATLKLISITRKYDIDLVHAHYVLPPGLIAILANIFTRRKTAVTVHGSDINILASNPLLRILIIYVLKKTDYIAVVNEPLKEKIIKLDNDLKDKLMVTPNAVDVEKYKPDNETNFIEDMNLDKDKPLILFVGNLVPQKGLNYLLEAKKILKTNVQLVIVGDGSLMMNLKEMVVNEDIKDVIFTGARRDVDKIMPVGDVFVLPSISEGFPITLLEAFASGLPAVATNVGGIPGLVTSDVGLLVEPGDPVALAESLDLILMDDKLKERMGNAALRKSQEYSTLKIPY